MALNRDSQDRENSVLNRKNSVLNREKGPGSGMAAGNRDNLSWTGKNRGEVGKGIREPGMAAGNRERNGKRDSGSGMAAGNRDNQCWTGKTRY
ncbi:hypothetical protein TURU_002322 [Turdus rufiventris]|nr:hypothetical protein TURU_002322 [Turdus rufiventris]